MSLLSVHFGHDSTFCYSPEDGVYANYEIERLEKKKHFGLQDEAKSKEHIESIVRTVVENIKKDFGNDPNLFKLDKFLFDTILPAWVWWKTPEEDPTLKNHVWYEFEEVIQKYFEIDKSNFSLMDHHQCHAYGGFYQSPFQEALVFTMDGMGTGLDNTLTYFTASIIDRVHHKYHELARSREQVDYFDLAGKWYRELMHFCEIYKNTLHIDVCGKGMGAAGYGRPNFSFIKDFSEVYNKPEHTFFGRFNGTYGSHGESFRTWSSPVCKVIQKHFGDNINKFDNRPSINDFQTQADFLASLQIMFEREFDSIIEPFVLKYNLPIVISGGAALNVLNNTRIKNKYKLPVFIPCNPNDSGLAFGHLVSYRKPYEAVDVRFSGFDIFDREELPGYVEERNAKEVDITQISKLLREGKIIGVIKGKSECGPRALGNRSIICDPSYPNMKDDLNAKVKGREWYRPFAPMVLQEDIKDYFEWDESSAPHMSFATLVKSQWVEKLPAITHVDRTARIQTITKQENSFYYDLLTEMKNTGLPVILNTSFNGPGKPILNSIKDALDLLDNSKMDYVIVENYLFGKNN